MASEQHECLKLNLGSGFIGLNDWINYDNSIVARFSRWPRLLKLAIAIGMLPDGYGKVQWPKITAHDCRKGLPHKDASVDYIYTSHFLEHLCRHETVDLLRECRRALKETGVLRVVVPDVDKLVTGYQQGKRNVFSSVQEIENPDPKPVDLFCALFYTSPLCRSSRRGFVVRFQELFLRHHRWMYNADSLENMLRYAGFSRIEKKNYRESDVPDVEKLDVTPEISLYMDARI